MTTWEEEIHQFLSDSKAWSLQLTIAKEFQKPKLLSMGDINFMYLDNPQDDPKAHLVLDDVKHLMKNFLMHLVGTLCPWISCPREEKQEKKILHIPPLECERNIYVNLASMLRCGVTLVLYDG